MLNDYLLQVNKPARYIGEEWNVSRKDFQSAGIKFALCFPDLYEVGMSNLGIRIIYGILNSMPDIICERFFSCGTDLEKILRSTSDEILSLESKKALKDFDIIGFSLGSELDYTNVLNILDLGNIPLQAKARDNAYPLVIAGGPSALNPEPMHEFFDLFLIGEAEDFLLEFIEAYRKHKTHYRAFKISKQDLLLSFSKLQGVYVPSFYEVSYDLEGKIREFKPQIEGVPPKIKKRFVKDFNSSFFPKDWLVPYIQTIHDRVTIEIMRGCPNRCSFCQAKSQYYPLRVRSIENILALAKTSHERTGYEEVSLAGLSVSDYPEVEKLIRELVGAFKAKGVSVSLPSIKAKAQVSELSSMLGQIKKTGLTFAPEAGSQRLRNILQKDFDETEFLKMLAGSYACGYQHVKLYFMIGIPFENREDLDGIIDLSVRVSELRKKVKNVSAKVNISINALIPKPHTSFQWFAMEAEENIRKKQDYLKDKTKNRRLKLNFHNPHMSFLEGVLSRGDRRLARVVSLAFKKGARFDAWGNYFNFEFWSDAFKESGLDPNFYLKERAQDEILPWDFIDTGIGKELILEEFNKLIDT
ncbi:MAG: TIGR03960 family B12-binding radical SAM protein [Candidatus Omnitrophota bacterium]